MNDSSNKQHLDDLREIRSLMERSTRFISLSGLSGIFAGIFALIGSYITWHYLNQDYSGFVYHANDHTEALRFLGFVAAGVLLLSLAAGIFFTNRAAKRKGYKTWDASGYNLLMNLAIPLVTGGLFCIPLLFMAPELIAPATLIFYGLALINASKYTLSDVRVLGFAQVITGLLAATAPGYGLLLWAFGFGLLHIVYGIIMYYKYEQ